MAKQLSADPTSRIAISHDEAFEFRSSVLDAANVKWTRDDGTLQLQHAIELYSPLQQDAIRFAAQFDVPLTRFISLDTSSYPKELTLAFQIATERALSFYREDQRG